MKILDWILRRKRCPIIGCKEKPTMKVGYQTLCDTHFEKLYGERHRKAIKNRK